MTQSLSKYFKSIAAKRLSKVEVDPKTSHQHELNGVVEFKEIFGTETIEFPTKFIYLNDNEDQIIESEGYLKWYDAREKHPTRSEYRLYYSDNQIIIKASEGDLIVLGRTVENSAVVLIALFGSTSEKQLLWLFDLTEVGSKFIVKDLSQENADFGFAGRYILSSLGIEHEETDPNYIEDLLKRFGQKFPTTKEFSEYARSTIEYISPIEDPDKTLIVWLEREELLFKTLEKVIVKEQLKLGFGEDGTDVEEFIKLSLSIQNRRKSRAGFSFENNLAVIFSINKINYSHGAVTERNNKPDFIFPGVSQYHDVKFDIALLTMLGVKTTAKDRWRQVLSEAAKIPDKHMITLEPAISRNQTEEMKANKLQLVIPSPLYSTYSLDQQKQLITLKDFIKLIEEKQKTNNLGPKNHT